MNGVLGDFGLQVVGDVLDDAGAGTSGAIQPPAAVGAGGQAVDLVMVDLFGSWARGTGVTDLGTARLATW